MAKMAVKFICTTPIVSGYSSEVDYMDIETLALAKGYTNKQIKKNICKRN